MSRVASGQAGRKVIFVGGTSYSGSTMLDMIIGNDTEGFSCGEIGALFHPYRSHHVTPRCGCGNPACDIWRRIRRAGPYGAYAAIFDMFPQVRFIVDSTKNPLWIKERTRELTAKGVDVRHVLIWKTPEEFRKSHEKRGRHSRIERAWMNYHHAYFSLIKGWRSIAYSDLVESPSSLEKLCGHLDVPWFDGKQRYWDKQHHIVFGNDSAKIHLYDRASESFRACDTRLRRMVAYEQGVPTEHRVMQKQTVTEGADMDGKHEQDGRLVEIMRMLRQRDIMAELPNTMDAQPRAGLRNAQSYWAMLLGAKRMLGTAVLRLRPAAHGWGEE